MELSPEYTIEWYRDRRIYIIQNNCSQLGSIWLLCGHPGYSKGTTGKNHINEGDHSMNWGPVGCISNRKSKKSSRESSWVKVEKT